MCVNNLSKVALDSAAAGIEPAISSRKSNALTTTPPSHSLFFTSQALTKLWNQFLSSNEKHFRRQ